MCSPQLIAQRVIHDFDRKPSLLRTRPFSRLYLWHPLSKVLIRSETRLMFGEWFNPHQARAGGKQETSPPKEKQCLVKTSETRVHHTTERGNRRARVRAGASQSDPRYSLPLSPSRSHSLSLSWIRDSVSPLTLPAENIIYWQFAYVGRPSAHCLPSLVDNAEAKWNPHQYYVCALQKSYFIAAQNQQTQRLEWSFKLAT